MTAYYNENDPQAAAWLRELIKNGLIAHGDVDERDIRDVSPADLGGYTQCHFFAGIGGWSYALRLARWPDDKIVWTGSCPCQPFSTAGQRSGVADERHLWPHFHWLIEQRRPSVVFGEQVASKDGLGWLDLVSADLEGSGYAFGAADLCAAGVGAPHIRQRLYWVANSEVHGCQQRIMGNKTQEERSSYSCGKDERSWGDDSANGGTAVRLADAHDQGLEGRQLSGERAGEQSAGEGCLAGAERTAGRSAIDSNVSGGMADSESQRRGLCDTAHDGPANGKGDISTNTSNSQSDQSRGEQVTTTSTRPTDGFWGEADWLFCRDGKWRAVEPGTFPLAHGVPARVGRLRGYGNAIVPQVAQTFIEAYLEAV